MAQPITYQIFLNSTDGGATSSPTVKPGDKVYWTAGSSAAFVNPPAIFVPQPSSPVNIAASGSSSTFNVNNKQNPGTYSYSSGLQGQYQATESVNDTIEVGSGEP